jgi:hypothetical protein
VADVEGDDSISPETLESFRAELYGAGDVIWVCYVTCLV